VHVPVRLPWPVPGRERRFHVALEARRRYGLDDELVTVRGDLLLADPDACARVAAAVEGLREPHEPPLSGADLYAGALLEEVYHLLIAHHRRSVDPEVFTAAAARVGDALADAAAPTLRAFVARYPSREVASGTRTPQSQLDETIDGIPGSEVVLEEMLTCWLANANPALVGARPLVDDRPLRESTAYDAVLASLRDTMGERPGPGGAGGSLFDELLAPMRASPTDLRGQLRFVSERWAGLLGEAFGAMLGSLLSAIDALEEVHRDRGGGAPGGPSPEHARGMIAGVGSDEERFSPDAGWMPRVVMMAKNTYVWLDQLARRYGREVGRLDQIPDEALADLARRGVNALWLIGLWERSPASRTIKQVRGQADAVASAYALYDYVIAADLGGEGAYERLRENAARHGLRLASDMVPNHVGIDGRWVVEHPSWFVQVDEPPFPSYRFDGPELSTDPRVSVKIEDRYFDGTDAAVVFQRRDTATGETRFVYHGNDGTAMPWNDTAQLDYLNAEVREAVIQTILAVARRFPIIRFDAAMTLARKHVRRLWYPEPGHGGAIPSRARYGALDDAAFDAAMPHEFWREVVDRVAIEAPDTLLLAEAFWMMEGFFVRTLGMHRVYNSAFMHMTKNEDGRGYRDLMKETLAFDPQIMKRFVNFMNNPDEESARVQFGDGDKYFAVATLLATLPGLPMIGHGQFEGYREKYGMEFRAPRTDESPDERLLARHDREVVPLLHRRAQFAEVERFRLFDVTAADGGVLEDVYAFSNHAMGSGSLVLVNLRFQRSEGALHRSVAFRTGDGGERQEDLATALGIRGGSDRFVVMFEQVAGLAYLHRADDVVRDGLWVRLDGYGRSVFVDVHERVDVDGRLARLHARLGGAGTPSLDEALEELRLEGVHEAFAALLRTPPHDADGLERAWARFLREGPVSAGDTALAPLTSGTARRREQPSDGDANVVAWALHLALHAAWPLETWRSLRLGRVVSRHVASASGGSVPSALGEVALAGWMASFDGWRAAGTTPDPARWLERSLTSTAATDVLGVNVFEGVRWFSREGVIALIDVTYALMRLQRPGAGPANAASAWRRAALRALEASGYRVDALQRQAEAVSATAANGDVRRSRGRTARRGARPVAEAEGGGGEDGAGDRSTKKASGRRARRSGKRSSG
jgi:glycosidase